MTVKLIGYSAMLRGISPMNAKMPELKKCFEAAGFVDVLTVLATGNVVFRAPASPAEALERTIENAMSERLGRTFLTIVRPLDALSEIVESDPFRQFQLAPGSKRIVSFLRDAPRAKLPLPIEMDGARILSVKLREVFSAYVPSPRGPVFMMLLEKTFGREITTRTWDTVKKVIAAGSASGASARTRRTKSNGGRPSRSSGSRH